MVLTNRKPLITCSNNSLAMTKSIFTLTMLATAQMAVAQDVTVKRDGVRISSTTSGSVV